MDRKIDLTEGRDFSGGHGIQRSEIDFTFWRNVRGTEEVGLGEYRRFLRHAEFFGKSWHENESYRVFGDRELKEIEGKCYRCGITLIPWRAVGDLCLECDKACHDQPAGPFIRKRMISNREIFSLR